MSIESRSRQYGKVFDHWQIKEFLGSGSGGKTAVFRLVRSDSGWGVSALKIVNLIEERGDIGALSNYQRQEYIDAREERSRNAEQEVRLMDALRGNTNIVDYLDHTFVDWSDETGFGRDMLIRMELLNDLRNDIRSGKIFSEAEILKIGHDICVALVLCHRKNILHRDIKPENIFQNKDGNYKLGDFGVSRVLDACPDAVASTGIGTFEYGPAEQMTGRYDKRVDIYSLGLVLYELSNDNRLPFAASTYVTGKEVSKRLSGVPFPRPSNASPALCKVILKACAFNPDERYQSAAEFLRDINMVRRKARGDIPRKLPQQEDVKAASAEDFKDDYATVLAKELGLPENLFMEDAYHTVPASANEVEGKAAPREKSYATEPAGKMPPASAFSNPDFYGESFCDLPNTKPFLNHVFVYGLVIVILTMIVFGVLSGIINLALNPIRNYRDVEISEEESTLANTTATVLTEYDFTEGLVNTDTSDTWVTEVLQNASSESPDKMEPIVLMGQTISTDITELDLTALVEEHDVVDAVSKLGQLPKLEIVTLNNSLTLDQVSRLQNSNDDATFQYSFTLFGKELSTLDTEVIFENQSIGDSGAEQIRQALSVLDNCDRFVLDNCGISDSLLADIREDFRDGPQVVWRVYFGVGDNQYNTLTDAEAIRAVYGVNDENSRSLGYCENVRYLDVGYNDALSDLSFIESMPDLEVLIASGCAATALDGLEKCQKLVWLELAFCEKLWDISALSSCRDLRYLNLSYTNVSNFTALETIALERFVCLNPVASQEAQNMFANIHEKCLTVFNGYSNPYGYGWRYDDNGITLNEYYKNVVQKAFQELLAP